MKTAISYPSFGHGAGWVAALQLAQSKNRITSIREREASLHRLETYADFADRVRVNKRKLSSFLIEAKTHRKSLVGYGALGKGNTLLTYCGIRADF